MLFTASLECRYHDLNCLCCGAKYLEVFFAELSFGKLTVTRTFGTRSCGQICPERQVNELHAFYDKYHKASSFLKSHQT